MQKHFKHACLPLVLSSTAFEANPSKRVERMANGLYHTQVVVFRFQHLYLQHHQGHVRNDPKAKIIFTLFSQQ